MFNKDKLKGFIAGVCVALIISSGVVFADTISKTVTVVYNNIKIVVDGEKITPKNVDGDVVEPFVIDGTTYLPLRAIATVLGKEVDWDSTSNTVYIGEKPERDFFQLETSTLTPYTEKPLFSINSTPVNGGVVNFYVVQDANEDNLRSTADNFAPSGTLQTLTIDGKPAAKFIVENAVADVHLIYAGCAEAEKTGYASKPEVKKEVDDLFAQFMQNFENEDDFVSFCQGMGITPSDLEAYGRKTFLFNSYLNNIHKETINKEIDTVAAEKEILDTYVTAKHILVKDEELANEIIKELDGGANFDELMKKHNTDPGATEEGYTFTKGEMVEPFETASYALDVNTYTKTPVKSTYGYHIIYRMPFDKASMPHLLYVYKEKKSIGCGKQSYFISQRQLPHLVYPRLRNLYYYYKIRTITHGN